MAYHDSDAANNGGSYRSTAVDIRTTKVGGGWQVGWFYPGEWLEYSVTIATTGAYDVSAHLASGAPSGAIHVSIDGRDATGPITFANTGGSDAFIDATRANVSLTAGPHILRMTCDAGGLDLDRLCVTAAGAGTSADRILQIDLGGSGMPTPGAWNNVTENSRSLAACIDATGAASGISLVTSGFGWPSSMAVNDGTVFPASA